MTRRARHPAALIAAACVLAPGAAPAGAALPPLGVGAGVRIEAAGGTLTVTLRPSGALYRAVRGHRLRVRCYRLSAFPTGPAVGDVIGQAVAVARGMHRVKLALPATPRPSFCALRGGAHAAAQVPLTREGAVWLDEQATAEEVQAVVTALSLATDDRGGTAWPDAAAAQALLRGRATPLPTADAPAPTRGVGVYTDGARHLRVSARSSLGRELYIEYVDDAVRSNALAYLQLG